MSDVSQGPGWWLASDGKWYPPHTAPQATLPPDAGVAYPGYAQPQPGPAAYDQGAAPAHQAFRQPAPDPYADQYGTPAGGYQQPGQPYQAGPSPTAPPAAGYGTAPGAGYSGTAPETAYGAYGYTAGAAAPEAGLAEPGPAPVRGNGVPATADMVAGSSPATLPATSVQQSITGKRRPHWQPWLALAGIAMIVWGAGQGVLAWAQWHVVQAQLSTFGTVVQGHVGMVLAAAGPVVAGIAAVAIALSLDRR